MAEEKKRERTKKVPDEEKAAGHGEAAPEEEVTEEAAEKTEVAEEAAERVEVAEEAVEKTEGTEKTVEKEEVAEKAIERAEETGAETTPTIEEEKVEEEQEGPTGEGEAAPVTKPEDLKKPLEKMTAKELREVALGVPGISGVHALKKEELLTAIQKAWGIKVEKGAKKEKGGKVAVSVAALKAKIHEIKAKRAEAIQKRDKRMARIYRRKINRLKKRTRRAA